MQSTKSFGTSPSFKSIQNLSNTRSIAAPSWSDRAVAFTLPELDSHPRTMPPGSLKRTSLLILPSFREYRTGLNVIPSGALSLSMWGMTHTSQTPSDRARHSSNVPPIFLDRTITSTAAVASSVAA